MEKMAATSTYSDEDPFLDCDELEEDKTVIDDNKHTYQIELHSSHFSYLLHKIIQFLQLYYCDNGNRGLRSVL